MKKEEFAQKAGIDPKALEGFSEETLDEMAMEAVEGGGDIDIGCDDNSGNCVAGCACNTCGGSY